MAFTRFDGRPEHGLQLVATLGPSSTALAPILADMGATGFRLNASHFTPPRLRRFLGRLQTMLPGCPIVVDLQGAKMRLGEFETRPVRSGEQVSFVVETALIDDIPLSHLEIFAAAQPGDTLSCDDGRLRFQTLEVAGHRLRALSLVDGELRPRSGIHLAEHPVHLADLAPHDLAVLDALASCQPVAFAISFMTTGEEVAWLKRRCPGSLVVGKIERPEAVAHLDAIAEGVDAMWICRGDLGSQLGSRALAEFVSAFDPRACKRPVLMAGQVLEHLTTHAVPTRTEICHLFDLVKRGYGGIVLSDETAIGEDPTRAVSTAAALIRAFAA